MANEADSRHTTPTLRWGETAAEVPDANVVEPSGGQKDVGLIPGVTQAVAEWANWLWWAAGVALRYIENVFELGFPRNFVMPGAASTEGVTTAGAGLSVDVTSARCWLSGAMYTVPAANDLALAAADPTNGRIDRIVARLTAGVPGYAVITGTPAASPTVPAAVAGDASISYVNVPATAVVPGTIVDLRAFGEIEIDHVAAITHLHGGDLGGGAWMLDVHELSMNMGDGTMLVDETDVFVTCTTFGIVASLVDLAGDLTVVGDTDLTGAFALTGNATVTGNLTVTGTTTVDAENFTLDSAITRKFDLHASDFVLTESVGTVEWDSGSGAAVWKATTTNDTATLWAAVRVPNGATITAVRVRGTKDHVDASAVFNFYSVAKSTHTVVFTETDSDTGSTGGFTLAVTGLSYTVDQNEIYGIEVLIGTGAGGTLVQLWSAEVEYTQTKPFDGL